MILGACIFGVEYSSLASEVEEAEKIISSQNAKIEAIESEKSDNESKIAKQQQDIDDLNSKNQKLESEIAHIKLTKAKGGSANKNTQATTIADEKIDLSNLTAPNEGYKVCYLTFDDGPSDNTLKILDILKKANAKASFFVIGTSKLDYIKRAHSEGHTIALHANQHDYAKIYKNETAYFNDLTAISNKVKDLIGVESKIIRFPGGSSNKVSKDHNKGIMTRLAKQVQDKGYVYADWNVDSTDASGNKVSKAKILSSIKSSSKGKGDICVLMHDTSAKTTTVEALPEIICYLRAQGYRFEGLTTDSPIFHHGINN